MYCVATEMHRIVKLHVAVKNIKLLSIATEMQQWVTFALLSSYKIFCTAANNINVLKSSCNLICLPNFTHT
jgi:hypothetical protein